MYQRKVRRRTGLGTPPSVEVTEMAVAAVVFLLALFSALSIMLGPERSSDPRDQLPIWARIGLR